MRCARPFFALNGGIEKRSRQFARFFMGYGSIYTEHQFGKLVKKNSNFHYDGTHASKRLFYFWKKSPSKSNVFLETSWSEVHIIINSWFWGTKIEIKSVRFYQFWYPVEKWAKSDKYHQNRFWYLRIRSWNYFGFFKPKCTPGHEVSKNTFDFDGDFFKSKSGCSRHVSSIISDNVATHVLNFLKCPFVVPSSSLSKIILHRLHKSTCITCSGPLGNWFLCAFLLEKNPVLRAKEE